MSQQHRRRWAIGYPFEQGVAKFVATEHARVLRVLVEGALSAELFEVYVAQFRLARGLTSGSLSVMTWLNEVDVGDEVSVVGFARRAVVQFESWAEWPL